MKVVIQRVNSARVDVEGKTKSRIGRGLFCLIGLKNSDTKDDADFIARKILGTRLWPREDGSNWQYDVRSLEYEVLMVSQFTLYGRLKGNKPDFSQAMSPDKASDMYEEVVELVRERYDETKVKDGIFGAMMNVSLENDGPVTMIIDSNKRNSKKANEVTDSEDEQ